MRPRGLGGSRRQRHPLEDEVLTMVLPDPLVLDIKLMMKTLRSAKKGSAGGPSGMTVEHLRRFLESGGLHSDVGGSRTQFGQDDCPSETRRRSAGYCGWRCVSAVRWSDSR